MRQLRLSAIYEWGIVAVLFLIVLHAPLAVWAGTTFPAYETVIKAWKEILLVVLGVIALALITRHKLWATVLNAWVVRLSLAFIALHFLLAAVLGGDIESVVAGIMIDIRFIVMFLLTYVLVLVRPASIRRIMQSVIAGAVIVLGFGLLQITVLPDDILRIIGYSRQTITPYTTIDSNPDYVRINSTLRGPNPLGAIMVVYAALAFAYLVARGRRRVIAFAGFVSSIALLFASFSRSAYIAAIGAFGLVVIASRRLSRKFVLAGLASSVVVAGGLVLVSSTDWYSNVVLHEDPESMVIEKSNDGHIESFKMGAERAVRQPIGAGIGSTGSASLYDDDDSNDAIIENYYFFVAHESGWLGLGLFVGLFCIVMAGLWRKRQDWTALAIFASGAGLAVIGVLLPVWADETVAFIWWGIAGALLVSGGIIEGGNGRRTRKQTSARTT